MAREKVTVLGGTGFLGRRVVQRLLEGPGFEPRLTESESAMP
jgi:nucleoside-diphosphate-sugar epimerase